jgi:ribonuclease G
MSKELFISSSSHETKVAVLEDDELVEVFFQRETDAGLVGNIYKGRVNRVLPGMQSAFVDVGLERDAFLYVSDFFEESDEYEKVSVEPETRAAKPFEEPRAAAEISGRPAAVTFAAEPEAETVPAPGLPPDDRAIAPAGAAAPAAVPSEQRAAEPKAERPSDRFDHRGRRRRRRGRGGRYEYRDSRPEPRPEPRPSQPSAPSGFELLPGESLAKYGQAASTEPAPAEPEIALAPEEPSPTVEVRAAKAAAEVHEPSVETVATEPSEEEPRPASPAMAEEATPAEGEISEDAGEGSVELEERLLVGDLRMAPLNFQPDSPGLSPTTEEAEPGTEESPAETVVIASEVESASEVLESEDEVDETETILEAEEVTDEAEEAAEVEARGPEEGSEAGAETEPPSEKATERTYTMRESQERPRYAPRRGRRGRGRFGRYGRRPEGGPRSEAPRSGNHQPVQIGEVLKEGQEILVQIAKEPLGTKGARITSHVALPGRYLVYMPTISHIGVSRKIASDEERMRLRRTVLEHRGPLTGGFIVRTAAAGRSEEELKADLRFLSNLWTEIRARAERNKAPALLHHDLTLVERILRDLLSPQFKAIRVDNEIEYQNTLEFVNRFQPSLVGHVKLHTSDTPLFEAFGVQAEIDKALKPKVWLKSGGYIVINQTEALVAIDVNTGKYVGKTNRLEDTIVKTNIDAVKEIVRQIRLRDLGGIIVIDFIDMDDRRNRIRVVQALEEALRDDRAPTKILSFNEFGLVALTRKRVKQSLERTLSEPCSYCSGSGWIKSTTTICYEILEEARKMASQLDGPTLTLRVHPDIAKALKSRDGALLAELESMTRKDVVIKGDASVHQERFEIF